MVLLSALFLISNILVRKQPAPVALEKNGFVFFENWKEYDEWMRAKLSDPDFDPDP